ncbi:hypothetical protein ANN_04904 [Periplaneta americana]|uniref:Uncharacterized protein n=1 Tax=Periplaneta americana TaxID=6978 RepID=A0ABQ8TB94_PERAM|nr:hypothetical protein ANN_04904 [Periplaneta americana]
MSPGSCTESYPAFGRIGLRETPGKTSTSEYPTQTSREETSGHPSKLGPSAADLSPKTYPKRWQDGVGIGGFAMVFWRDEAVDSPWNHLTFVLKLEKTSEKPNQQPDKSTVAQHSLEMGKMDFDANMFLNKPSSHWDLVFKEAIEIQLHSNNIGINRDGGLQLSTASKPIINTLRPIRTRQEVGTKYYTKSQVMNRPNRKQRSVALFLSSVAT